MPRGGFRPNSGPKKGAKYRRRPAEPGEIPPIAADADPLDVIRTIMRTTADEKVRLRAAEDLAQYEHLKAADKATRVRERQRAEAEQVAANSGKFTPRRAPKLIVDNK
jgi:hypothetical protein